MAAILLIPAYMGIKQTASGETMQLPEHSFLTSAADLLNRQFALWSPISHDNFDGNANLYIGIFSVLAVGLYVLNGEIKVSEKIKKVLLIGLFYLSFSEMILNFIWHGFHDQYGIPNRFAFLYIFALLAMAYEGYCVLVRGKRKVSLWIYFAVILCGILIGITMKTSTVKLEMKTVYATVAAIAVYKENSAGNVSSVTYSVQKLSGKTWKTVATGLSGVAKNNYVVTTGLAAGTYRVVANAASGEILYFINANQKASDSYGTSKKKAKEIKRKKSKKQVFLSNESTSKTHWYKIKVKKTGMTYIDITGLGNKSKISVTVTGAARLKNKTISKGFRIYGKAKKGTYYIKIKKGSKGTSGYQVKYTK